MIKADIWKDGRIRSEENKLKRFLEGKVGSEYVNSFMSKYNQKFPAGNPKVYEFEDWITKQENEACRRVWAAIRDAK